MFLAVVQVGTGLFPTVDSDKLNANNVKGASRWTTNLKHQDESLECNQDEC